MVALVVKHLPPAGVGCSAVVSRGWLAGAVELGQRVFCAGARPALALAGMHCVLDSHDVELGRAFVRPGSGISNPGTADPVSVCVGRLARHAQHTGQAFLHHPAGTSERLGVADACCYRMVAVVG